MTKNRSKMVQNGQNLVKNGQKWSKIVKNGSKMIKIGQKCSKMVQNDPKWSEKAEKWGQMDQKWSEKIKNDPKQLFYVHSFLRLTHVLIKIIWKPLPDLKSASKSLYKDTSNFCIFHMCCSILLKALSWTGLKHDQTL